MKFLKSLFKLLNATDLSVVCFFLFLSFLNLIFYERITGWYLLIIINSGVISLVFYLAKQHNSKPGKGWMYAHYFYLVPLILFTFKELYLMVKPIRNIDYDQTLIAIDRFIFGADPTVVLYKFAHPVLTELLQIVYATFYFLPVILGINLVLKKKWIELEYMAFCVVYGFFLSYIGYFLVPAVGPRFTLHDFAATDSELPGLFITNLLREVTNLGESIPNGTLNPAELVQRDVFPSGHTQMTLIVMYVAYKLNVKSRYFIIPDGLLLIFSTLYLRYHYFIDLVGGLVFMIITMWTGNYIFNFWQRFKGLNEYKLSKLQ
ncbi:MAG: phosphatase PAP2 family protein [Ignavibacteriales bacterium]|nr:MAG: phosphatase PAP2 family protein [Ignavibacteriales bacterium]